MGRLTLNVLLSFAQFEREVTSERIRDKIAASKRKGLWVGGMAPLGYDTKDRKITVQTGSGPPSAAICGSAAYRDRVRFSPRRVRPPVRGRRFRCYGKFGSELSGSKSPGLTIILLKYSIG